ncbi:hypothetical protein NEOKW01_0128 [Nematocida sp. AWRm80]|nr:hypothetical protein NEOKW01_0128 [Nematocida sp. AWRm80]
MTHRIFQQIKSNLHNGYAKMKEIVIEEQKNSVISKVLRKRFQLISADKSSEDNLNATAFLSDVEKKYMNMNILAETVCNMATHILGTVLITVNDIRRRPLDTSFFSVQSNILDKVLRIMLCILTQTTIILGAILLTNSAAHIISNLIMQTLPFTIYSIGSLILIELFIVAVYSLILYQIYNVFYSIYTGMKILKNRSRPYFKFAITLLATIIIVSIVLAAMLCIPFLFLQTIPEEFSIHLKLISGILCMIVGICVVNDQAVKIFRTAESRKWFNPMVIALLLTPIIIIALCILCDTLLGGKPSLLHN